MKTILILLSVLPLVSCSNQRPDTFLAELPAHTKTQTRERLSYFINFGMLRPDFRRYISALIKRTKQDYANQSLTCAGAANVMWNELLLLLDSDGSSSDQLGSATRLSDDHYIVPCMNDGHFTFKWMTKHAAETIPYQQVSKD